MAAPFRFGYSRAGARTGYRERETMRKSGLFAGWLALSFVATFSFGGRALAARLPDPLVTPGATTAGVTSLTVCKPGYDRSPPPIPAAVRAKVYAAYGLPKDACASGKACTLDHLIPVALGGSNVAANIWPQPTGGHWNARRKDRLEKRLHKMVCFGEISLKRAQKVISRDWIAEYQWVYGE